MDSRHFWEDNGQPVKYDNYASNDGFGRVGGDQLNFAAPSEDEAEYPTGAYLKKGKVSRQDPMSHRIIEKRRRDRMNNCLADLSRMIPPEYLKKGRGRVEKTEIIEMAIRHLKYLQDRTNVVERLREDAYRAGYQEAVGEAMRFLVEIQGYAPGDGLCVSLTSHLQRHVDIVTKGEIPPREKHHHSHAAGGSSSETTSSSGSSHGFVGKPGVIAQAPPPAPPTFSDHYETPADVYNMECDRVSVSQMPVTTDNEILPETEHLPLDGRRKRSPTLRTVRKFDHTDAFLHSYKFKNSIERRFSRSQDNEAAALSPHAKSAHYTHKRRRAARPALPASTSASTSGSTEDARDTSPQDTSSESPHHHHYDKALTTTGQHVPIFALNTHGKYYIPLSIEYSCLAHHIGPFDLLDARAVNVRSPLHPVTIHVNFHPFLNYHMKREQHNEQDWRPS